MIFALGPLVDLKVRVTAVAMRSNRFLQTRGLIGSLWNIVE